MKLNTILNIIIVICLGAILYGLLNINNNIDNRLEKQEQKYEEIVKNERAFRDSLMKYIIDIYEKPDTQSIKNYYTNKYEEGKNFIIDNNVDSDIVFFSKWYHSQPRNRYIK